LEDGLDVVLSKNQAKGGLQGNNNVKTPLEQARAQPTETGKLDFQDIRERLSNQDCRSNREGERREEKSRERGEQRLARVYQRESLIHEGKSNVRHGHEGSRECETGRIDGQGFQSKMPRPPGGGRERKKERRCMTKPKARPWLLKNERIGGGLEWMHLAKNEAQDERRSPK